MAVPGPDPRRQHTETKHRHNDNKKIPIRGALNQPKEENSPDRPLLRVALTPGFAVTDHRAAYDVAVLADPGAWAPHASAAALPIGGDTEITPLYGASERLNQGE